MHFKVDCNEWCRVNMESREYARKANENIQFQLGGAEKTTWQYLCTPVFNRKLKLIFCCNWIKTSAWQERRDYSERIWGRRLTVRIPDLRSSPISRLPKSHLPKSARIHNSDVFQQQPYNVARSRSVIWFMIPNTIYTTSHFQMSLHFQIPKKNYIYIWVSELRIRNDKCNSTWV